MSNLSIRGLIKSYANFTAVNGINLDVAEGEFVVLLGPSGCGKTTTLRCIAGLEDITDGQIIMGGQVVSQKGRSLPPEQRSLGMVFQSYAIWPHMTAGDNVAFGLKIKKLPANELKAKVESVLELVGLKGFANRDVSRMSGGQQQRVALARAIALEPQILLFDEPLSNLDAKLRERMRVELRELQRRLGIAAIYVTHDQQEAMALADRVVLMHDGRIEQIAPPAELYRRPASLFSADFVGLTNIMAGKVSATGSETRVILDSGLEIESQDRGFSIGEVVDAVCRPEELRISLQPLSGRNVFQATVRNIVFLGNIADVYITIGDLSLRGQLSTPQDWLPGSPVWLQIDPATVVLLRHETTATKNSLIS